MAKERFKHEKGSGQVFTAISSPYLMLNLANLGLIVNFYPSPEYYPFAWTQHLQNSNTQTFASGIIVMVVSK